MSARRGPDARIAAYFATAQAELPDQTLEAVRVEIHRTRQVARVSLLGGSAGPRGFALLVAAAAAVTIAVLVFTPRQGFGPGGTTAPQPTAEPSIAGSATPSASTAGTTAPAGPTRFTSPLYHYGVTIPAGWISAEAFIPWDGKRQPGPDADVDRFVGPGQLSAFGFAGPFKGGLAAFVNDRIAANAHDQADTCPRRRPDSNEPLQIGSQRWVLLGWNCRALINQALTVRAGIAYAFTFRDLGIDAASDPTDRALFQSILDSVELPS
jgi:hypothetical protein